MTLSVSDEQGLSHSISHSITIEADSSGGITELSNGQSVSISGAQDSEQVFRITLPQGTSALDVTLSEAVVMLTFMFVNSKPHHRRV